jgi:hypothetical protein
MRTPPRCLVDWIGVGLTLFIIGVIVNASFAYGKPLGLVLAGVIAWAWWTA